MKNVNIDIDRIAEQVGSSPLNKEPKMDFKKPSLMDLKFNQINHSDDISSICSPHRKAKPTQQKSTSSFGLFNKNLPVAEETSLGVPSKFPRASIFDEQVE